MEKYYTPAIEEFHVGFEYESNLQDEGWEKEVFEPNRVDDSYLIGMFFSKIKQLGAYRVKHLDQEDIESLGFNQISDNCFNLPLKDAEELRILYENGTIVIFFADRYSDKLFQGTIKNKSELKKVLKMIGVNN